MQLDCYTWLKKIEYQQTEQKFENFSQTCLEKSNMTIKNSIHGGKTQSICKIEIII